ncbi:hypothetical protein FJO69_02135 [[Mycoplasma] falconis]|uniref:Uncharacterized protein n=1 Tax=[Mycoplasma] falconis TaxID=92403 RepID=A0A501X9Q3_9BACT|nr:hypothetical protein FJO69_02135 [[Mycoplasma] falconis]
MQEAKDAIAKNNQNKADKIEEINNKFKEIEEWIKGNLTKLGLQSIKEKLENQVEQAKSDLDQANEEQLNEKLNNLDQDLTEAKQELANWNQANDNLQGVIGIANGLLPDLSQDSSLAQAKKDLEKAISLANQGVDNHNKEQLINDKAALDQAIEKAHEAINKYKEDKNETLFKINESLEYWNRYYHAGSEWNNKYPQYENKFDKYFEAGINADESQNLTELTQISNNLAFSLGWRRAIEAVDGMKKQLENSWFENQALAHIKDQYENAINQWNAIGDNPEKYSGSETLTKAIELYNISKEFEDQRESVDAELKRVETNWNTYDQNIKKYQKEALELLPKLDKYSQLKEDKQNLEQALQNLNYTEKTDPITILDQQTDLFNALIKAQKDFSDAEK